MRGEHRKSESRQPSGNVLQTLAWRPAVCKTKRLPSLEKTLMLGKIEGRRRRG